MTDASELEKQLQEEKPAYHPVSPGDLEKIKDVMQAAATFHQRRDEMNAAVHLAPAVRYSPLTVELAATVERLVSTLEEDPV